MKRELIGLPDNYFLIFFSYYSKMCPEINVEAEGAD
jgi:hypothetical protein